MRTPGNPDQERLEALFANALDAILLMDDRGFFVDENPSAERLLGYPLRELIQMHFSDLTPAPSDVDARQRWSEFEVIGRHVGEIALRRKDGGMVDVEYRAVRDIQPGLHLVVARDITERKRAEADQRENAARLESLSRRLVHAQEGERRHISRELHDEIGQTLTAVILGLDAAQRACACGGSTSNSFGEARDAVERAITRVRAISLGLRPLILDDLGLPAALRWYLDGLAQRNGTAIHFSSTMPPGRLSMDVETACFRIVQEALTNVLRHAEAADVWVTLWSHQQWLELTIRDNGVGFDAEAALKAEETGAALGLAGMRERVRLLGGTIEMTSSAGQGTEIAVTLLRSPAAGDLA